MDQTDHQVEEFRQKCVSAVERCDDPDLLGAMVAVKRLYEQSQAELDTTKKALEQAIELGKIHSDGHGIFAFSAGKDVHFFPELYAALTKEADRGL